MGCREGSGPRNLVRVWRRRALLAAALAIGSGCGGGDEKGTRLNPQPEIPVILNPQPEFPRSAGTTQEITKSQGGAASKSKGLQGASPSDATRLQNPRAALLDELGAGGDGQR